ncbi:hypothetical protein TNIN_61281 [Trichonephila inaurata madagascariensis]|uniref:Uncharacterized protein n=1 Tax=Trichonephila inaurata madagascariensis TaxID=2747483 RepID=A0A8X6IRR4_9ARAC|nr:hypothetical protein TNIN_61281 [Trichonephila inaurata madagascariensis]
MRERANAVMSESNKQLRMTPANRKPVIQMSRGFPTLPQIHCFVLVKSRASANLSSPFPFQRPYPLPRRRVTAPLWEMKELAHLWPTIGQKEMNIQPFARSFIYKRNVLEGFEAFRGHIWVRVPEYSQQIKADFKI